MKLINLLSCRFNWPPSSSEVPRGGEQSQASLGTTLLNAGRATPTRIRLTPPFYKHLPSHSAASSSAPYLQNYRSMSDLLKEIDDAWFSDADEISPPVKHEVLLALGLDTSPLPPPGTLTPMPIAGHPRLSTEEGNEFSRPNMALGTVVDAPVPKSPWFSEMRSLVPRRRARPSSLPPIPSAKRRAAPLHLAPPVAPPVAALDENVTLRKSWWRRAKKD